MIRGMNNFFGLDKHSEMLIVGHSHLMLATDVEKMQKELGIPISKYTREGVNVADREIMISQFLNSPYSDSLKVCLYGVDLFSFTGEGLSANSYKLFYPFMDDPQIDRYIKSQTTSSDYWSHKLLHALRYNDDTAKNSVLRGWCNDWSNKKYGHVDVESYQRLLDKGQERHIEMNPELIETFDRSVKALTERGIKVVLVNTPTLDLLNSFESEKFQNICQWFQNYAHNNEKVEYWDFNPDYSSMHEIFHDKLHLNVDGQQMISEKIISLLNSYFLF